MQSRSPSFLFVLTLLCLAFAHGGAAQVKTVEFLSPLDAEGKHDAAAARQSCFSFVTETAVCSKASDLYYGTLRKGDEWDWFQVMGAGSRNKIKKIGKKDWADEFKIPVVEPYAALKQGEQRRIVLDASGADGADGRPGTNGDGTVNYASNVVDKDLSQVDNRPKREKLKSDYDPYEKALVGNMYVMRVVDENNDFYVLFRVDELERGKRCKISWKRIEAPAEN